MKKSLILVHYLKGIFLLLKQKQNISKPSDSEVNGNFC